MKTSPKVRFLNFFRNIFKISFLERQLVKRTTGRSTYQFWSKFVPSAYQYPPGSFRIVDQNGLKLKVDISDYIGHYLYFGFKDETIDVLFSLCKPASYVIDVGTNIGWTLLNLAQRSPQGKIVGFEPDPYNYQVCKENIQLNHLNNIVLLQRGLGAQAAKTTMEVRTPNNRGGNRISPATTPGSIEVTIERLDQVEELKSWTRVDLIKIDVEGYELDVLQGAEGLLQKHQPILFIEIDDNNLKDQGHSAHALISFLNENGYQKILHADTKELIFLHDNFKDCHFDIIAQ